MTPLGPTGKTRICLTRVHSAKRCYQIEANNNAHEYCQEACHEVQHQRMRRGTMEQCSSRNLCFPKYHPTLQAMTSRYSEVVFIHILVDEVSELPLPRAIPIHAAYMVPPVTGNNPTIRIASTLETSSQQYHSGDYLLRWQQRDSQLRESSCE
ncbi:hypothetical protein M514_09626, partial [Trichuris suis]